MTDAKKKENKIVYHNHFLSFLYGKVENDNV